MLCFEMVYELVHIYCKANSTLSKIYIFLLSGGCNIYRGLNPRFRKYCSVRIRFCYIHVCNRNHRYCLFFVLQAPLKDVILWVPNILPLVSPHRIITWRRTLNIISKDFIGVKLNWNHVNWHFFPHNFHWSGKTTWVVKFLYVCPNY